MQERKLLTRALIIYGFLGASLFAQSIRGRVTDPDGAPVSRAMVQALNSLETHFTNEQAEFVIDMARLFREVNVGVRFSF